MEVFQQVPKEVRDFILELKGDEEKKALSDLGREMLRLTVRFKRERNMDAIAKQIVVPEGVAGADDDELMDIADKLISDVKIR
jgi:hypothetical protein